MRLKNRTALAIYSPALHVALIEAELRFNEHAFIEAEIEKRKGVIALPVIGVELSTRRHVAYVECCLLRDVKLELSMEYYPR